MHLNDELEIEQNVKKSGSSLSVRKRCQKVKEEQCLLYTFW